MSRIFLGMFIMMSLIIFGVSVYFQCVMWEVMSMFWTVCGAFMCGVLVGSDIEKRS